MELENKIAQLEAEKSQYITTIDNVNAEKIALDQMLVENLKNTLNSKKDMIMMNQKLFNLQTELNNANKEIVDLKDKIANLYAMNPILNEEKN